MTLEDPFFVVKDEVFKALNKTRGLYLRWRELQDDFDLYYERRKKNPSKFKIDNKEITTRKHFIDSTKSEVKSMKEKINMSKNRDKDRIARQPLLDNSPVRASNTHGTTKYSKLENDLDSPQRQFLKRNFVSTAVLNSTTRRSFGGNQRFLRVVKNGVETYRSGTSMSKRGCWMNLEQS
ncbi:hypothetical protein NQ318_015954 [Aromia moschata]|uniref:Uncharacterized protein n=1 Tax=Aromia moschata TaxID=1265417 RepID=A0AAV8X931_9CUCU|nr:hypothetical protein NQ318_015954 [Aromia moschata]